MIDTDDTCSIIFTSDSAGYVCTMIIIASACAAIINAIVITIKIPTIYIINIAIAIIILAINKIVWVGPVFASSSGCVF